MTILEAKRLTTHRKEQIAALEALCREADGDVCPIFCDSALNYTHSVPAFFFAVKGGVLLGALSIFLPGDGTGEISALVAPDCRRQGIFTELLKHAVNTVKILKLRQVLTVTCPSVAVSGYVLKKLKAKPFSQEFKLKLDSFKGPVPPARTEYLYAARSLFPDVTFGLAEKGDFPELAPLLADLFGTDLKSAETWLASSVSAGARYFKLMRNEEIIGCGGLIYGKCSISLFGLGIKERYRGRGLGNLLLGELLAMVPGGYSAVLEVSDKNPAALGLYKKFGFAVTQATQYHTVSLT